MGTHIRSSCELYRNSQWLNATRFLPSHTIGNWHSHLRPTNEVLAKCAIGSMPAIIQIGTNIRLSSNAEFATIDTNQSTDACKDGKIYLLHAWKARLDGNLLPDSSVCDLAPNTNDCPRRFMTHDWRRFRWIR